MKLDVYLQERLAGWLAHDAASNEFAFEYAPEWRAYSKSYPLSPHLPFDRPVGQSEAMHSAIVRQFFENLLPEGAALDDAATANGVSKSNLIALMIALGRETAGALRICAPSVRPGTDQGEPAPGRRVLSKEELSRRIRERPSMPFSVWDGKVRLSIAGFQDKIAVLKDEHGWSFADVPGLASTVILKPDPINPALSGLTTNEFFCMRLARHMGLEVADVRLVHVPEPVLEITRFDRQVQGDTVLRAHVIDGCQALGISVGMKYERPYGDGADVRDHRDGASLPRLFDLLSITTLPAGQRRQLLRWVLFQILIGNADAHAKTLSFFLGPTGMFLTPAYDQVCTLIYGGANIAETFAMAIGDAFAERELTAYEWAHFAANCGLLPRVVATEMRDMIKWFIDCLDLVIREVAVEGGQSAVVDQVVAVIRRQCERHAALAPMIAKVDPSLF